jgi:coatomer protein complex subunit epsilon
VNVNISALKEAKYFVMVYLQLIFCISRMKHAYSFLQLVLGEISGQESDPALKAVGLLARVSKSADDSATQEAAETVREWIEDPSVCRNETAMIVAATVLRLAEDYETALKACHMGGGMENMAMSVQILLDMNRVDAAQKVATKMSEINDDDTLAQLAAALVGSRQGGRKLQEAYYIYQELGDKYTWTVKLHNGLACCQMEMERWEDAEAELLQAFEKNPKDADTLSNLAVVSLHLGKSANRYIGLLESNAPNHPMAVRMSKAEKAFDAALEATNVA